MQGNVKTDPISFANSIIFSIIKIFQIYITGVLEDETENVGRIPEPKKIKTNLKQIDEVRFICKLIIYTTHIMLLFRSKFQNAKAQL